MIKLTTPERGLDLRGSGASRSIVLLETASLTPISIGNNWAEVSFSDNGFNQ